MNMTHFRNFVCPFCHSRLKIPIGRMDDIVRFNCNHQFKIRNGIPVFIASQRQNAYQTQRSFGFKWSSQPRWGFSQKTHGFMERWFYEKYGWKNKASYVKFLSTKKMILDAGCGLGREAYNMARLANKAVIYASDFSDSIFHVPQKVRNLQNICLINADINSLPFKFGFFDFILSEGVIHHTPHPYETFRNLVRMLTKGGEIALYVYNKKPVIREYVDNFIRSITTAMPADECMKFSHEMTRFGRFLSKSKKTVVFKRGLPEIGIVPGKYTLHELMYNYFMKCFWNDSFSTAENCLVNFDWYHPRYASSHTIEEICAWAKKHRVDVYHTHTSPSGITIRGIKR